MKVSSFGHTDVGRKRDHNEDAFFADDELALYAVADGMGGHAAGEVASATAVEEVERVVRERFPKVRARLGEQDHRDRKGHRAIEQVLVDAVQQACAKIYGMSQKSREKRGMGTTLEVLLVDDPFAYIAHVGDSRVYLLRSGDLHQLTEDHSLIREQVKRGIITPEEAKTVPYTNVITRAVGIQQRVNVDALHLEVAPGDRFLLCSDGLHGYFGDKLLRRALTEFRGEGLVHKLIELANRKGGKDNITAVFVDVLAEVAEEKLSDLDLRLDTLKQIPLYKYLTYKELVKVLNIIRLRRYAKGELIFEEGSRGRELYIVFEGRCEVVKGGTRIAEIGQGGHLGELSMVDRHPRSATVRAIEDSRMMVVERPEFYELIRQETSLAVKLLWSFIQVLSERLRDTNEALQGAREELVHFGETTEDSAPPVAD